jgi:hypothetical protein
MMSYKNFVITLRITNRFQIKNQTRYIVMYYSIFLQGFRHVEVYLDLPYTRIVQSRRPFISELWFGTYVIHSLKKTGGRWLATVVDDKRKVCYLYGDLELELDKMFVNGLDVLGANMGLLKIGNDGNKISIDVEKCLLRNTVKSFCDLCGVEQIHASQCRCYRRPVCDQCRRVSCDCAKCTSCDVYFYDFHRCGGPKVVMPYILSPNRFNTPSPDPFDASLNSQLSPSVFDNPVYAVPPAPPGTPNQDDCPFPSAQQPPFSPLSVDTSTPSQADLFELDAPKKIAKHSNTVARGMCRKRLFSE